MNYLKQCFRVMLCGAILCSLADASTVQDITSSNPETVLATYRVWPAKLEDFLRLMPEYWAALRTRGLVFAEPHVLLRGEENGKPIVVEVFSWKDHDAPEHIPAAIQVYWDRLNDMVEYRDGHTGIEFPEMTIVQSRDR